MNDLAESRKLKVESRKLKSISALCFLFSALLLGGGGCKKQAAFQPPKTLEEGFAQLRVGLLKASPNVQSNLYSGVDYGIRYGNYKDAAAALARIASDPGLNDQQKKLVNNVAELLKARLENPTGAAKPAT